MHGNKKAIKLLLVEDNLGDVRIIQEILNEVDSITWSITHVSRLEDALVHTSTENPDIVLLDLGLPDSTGFDTFLNIRDNIGDTPIILLTGLDDELVAIKSVQEGAQDYINKSDISKELLTRSIQYSIERHNLIAQIRSKSIIDGLTGLYNRRGFFTLAEKDFKMLKRSKNGFIIVYVDLDGLKWINDHLGHHQGDQALIDLANMLKNSFRETDIIGRIGGDEFVIIALNSKQSDMKLIRGRIEEHINNHNKNSNNQYNLSASIGLVSCEPNEHSSLDDIMKVADKKMYEEKQTKKARSNYIENLRNNA